MNTFYIDTSQVQQFTNKLRELHRSHFPIVVRQTLNDTAFDVMKTTLPKHFTNEFTIRNNSFLKSHLSVQKVRSQWDIKTMKSIVGITPKGSTAANDLIKQEFGGTTKKQFIYMDSSRISNSRAKLVRLINYVNKKGLIKGSPNLKRNSRSQFVADAIMAKKLNKVMFGQTKSGTTMFDVQTIKFGKQKTNYNNMTFRTASVKLQALADYEPNRIIRNEAKPFFLPASKESHAKMLHFFIENAKKRIEKALK
jgi:hypothetical protein